MTPASRSSPMSRSRPRPRRRRAGQSSSRCRPSVLAAERRRTSISPRLHQPRVRHVHADRERRASGLAAVPDTAERQGLPAGHTRADGRDQSRRRSRSCSRRRSRSRSRARLTWSTNSTTFMGVPDIPQTRLTVTLNGGPNACLPRDVHARSRAPRPARRPRRTADQTVVASSAFTVANCPGKKPPHARPPAHRVGPAVGAAHGAPTLTVRLLAGHTCAEADGPLRSRLPNGLRFVAPRSRVSGVSVSAGAAESITISGGRLVVVDCGAPSAASR